MTHKEAAAKLDAAMKRTGEAAKRTAAKMRALENARPKSEKGTGRVPARVRTAPKARPFVVAPDLGVYTKPDGTKVKGSRAQRRAAGQRSHK